MSLPLSGSLNPLQQVGWKKPHTLMSWDIHISRRPLNVYPSNHNLEATAWGCLDFEECNRKRRFALPLPSARLIIPAIGQYEHDTLISAKTYQRACSTWSFSSLSGVINSWASSAYLIPRFLVSSRIWTSFLESRLQRTLVVAGISFQCVKKMIVRLVTV